MFYFQIRIERVRFADSGLAKLLLRLARWRNWKSSGGHTRYSDGQGIWRGYDEVGSYISEKRWNFRLASKIATYLKEREEDREAEQYKKYLTPAALELVTRPVNSVDAFDQTLYNNLLENKKNEPS